MKSDAGKSDADKSDAGKSDADQSDAGKPISSGCHCGAVRFSARSALARVVVYNC